MSAALGGMILHVDDHQAVRASLSMLLSMDGHIVTSAACGTEALRLAAEGIRPDILIVDFNLGEGMNGAELVLQLRRPLGYTPPVIMLTGDPRSADLPRIIEAPTWMLRKPLDPELLLASLPSLVQLSRATRGLLTRA